MELEKKYANTEVFKKGRVLRRNLNDLVFIIKVNDQINEIDKKNILEKLIKEELKTKKRKK
jgi:hypothetical protein